MLYLLYLIESWHGMGIRQEDDTVYDCVKEIPNIKLIINIRRRRRY